MSILGSLWRRCVYVFTSYPYRLVDLAYDPDVTRRTDIAVALLATNDGCLDPHFSRKLKSWVTDPQELVEDDMRSFLAAVFDHMLVTTTHIENSFAHMRAYTTKCLRPPHARSLSHRHADSGMRTSTLPQPFDVQCTLFVGSSMCVGGWAGGRRAGGLAARWLGLSVGWADVRNV